MMARSGALACLLLLSACGEEGRSLEVRFTTSALPRLDPFVSSGLRQVRVSVVGAETHDEILIDVDLGARGVSLDGLVSDQVAVQIEGLDAAQSVVAFGRASVNLGQESQVDIPFRRNLAYVIHQPVAGQKQPARSIYALDLASRSLVDEILLPGAIPEARGITPRGGDSMIVTWRDGPQGQVGLLSLDDHSIGNVVVLPGIQDTCVGAEGSSRAVAVGLGRISFVDFRAGSAVALDQGVGGTVIDAVISGDGRRALVSLQMPSALLLVDLERQEVEAQTVLPDPGGLALDAAGQVAFVTSRTARQVAAFELGNRRTNLITGFLAAPVDLAVFSEPLRAVVGVNRDRPVGRILAFSTSSGSSTPLEGAIETLEAPMSIAADGTGRRFVVVAGSSTVSAGLTIIDTGPSSLQGSGRLYPGDPDDTFTVSSGSPDREPVLGRQRYQPRAVAVAYGR
ncbi:MAG: hypothetical protein AAFZ18_11115 [Myxococcota bacterium]